MCLGLKVDDVHGIINVQVSTPKIATLFVQYFFFYSYFQSLLHMNQKATFLFSLYEAKSSARQNLRAAQVGFFCQCVCPCAHCRYTQHILTVYLSHVEISLEVSLGIKTFSKKTNKKKQNKKNIQ